MNCIVSWFPFILFSLIFCFYYALPIAQVAVTLILTDIHLYLGLENPQWPLPKLHPLPDKDDLLPPFSGVIQKGITDIEQVVCSIIAY